MLGGLAGGPAGDDFLFAPVVGAGAGPGDPAFVGGGPGGVPGGAGAEADDATFPAAHRANLSRNLKVRLSLCSVGEPVFEGMTERLRRAARSVRDLHEAWQTELTRRDELVAQAADEGMPQRAIAAALGITHQRVGRLMLPRSDL